MYMFLKIMYPVFSCFKKLWLDMFLATKGYCYDSYGLYLPESDLQVAALLLVVLAVFQGATGRQFWQNARRKGTP